MDRSKSLVLVDAYSQIFRSFFAIRMLTNSRGEPVNAAFVFTKLLLQLEKSHPSPYGAMLFDCGKVAFRLELNPQYKANRPPMPDALRQQMPLIREIAEAFGWELLQCDGLEADDLIGGLSCRFSDLPVEIVSSDKDLSQLIDERVTMLIPGSGASGFNRRGIAEVKEKFGVAPEEMVDYLALIGDNSDNIPGVPGIGPKSAVDILQLFGAADRWLNAPEKIDAENKYGKKLLPALDIIRRNRELIRLRTDLPEELQLDTPPVRHKPDWRRITEICRDNQFRSILKELPEIEDEKDDFFEDDLFAFAKENSAVQVAGKSAADGGEEIQGELF
ncbi:MAG: hypothetical protein IKC82_06015 [Lentisphaeria bacterium]|nr:hypothetical protein [Lentisphaeria bacterium]